MESHWEKEKKAHYGKHSAESEAAIKALYIQLDLSKVFEEQEDSSYKRIVSLFSKAKDLHLPIQVFQTMLDKVSSSSSSFLLPPFSLLPFQIHKRDK